MSTDIQKQHTVTLRMNTLATFNEFLQTHALLLTLASMLMLIVGSLVAAWFITVLPADYFVSSRRRREHDQHWLLRVAVSTLKNIVGMALIVAGLIMLLTPGQGLLTLLAGVMLTNFPGKHALESRIVRNEQIMRSLNWLRARKHKPPFTRPAKSGG